MSNYLTYKGYLGTVNFDSDDEAFHGKINGINDLITFEGQSVKALKKAFEEAVDDYLKTCQELGKQPDKTYKGSFNVRISTELHKKATTIATKKQISLNDFVKRAIYYAIAHEKDIDNNLACN
ncbi:MAG: type II toxin-antitoxin system HicB family antitoxin [Cytophagales bacterium]|nr:type II toxin-antitoxin system HicB family antitoxin [Cytophagales bacterium]